MRQKFGTQLSKLHQTQNTEINEQFISNKNKVSLCSVHSKEA